MATKYWTVQMCCFLTFTVCDIAVLKFIWYVINKFQPFLGIPTSLLFF